MTVAVIVILASLSIFAVAWPFFRPAKAERRRTGDDRSRMKPVPAGLGVELESDLRTGIISAEEYKELRQSHPTASQGVKREGTEADEIERKVRELRQRRGSRAQTPVAGGKSADNGGRSNLGGAPEGPNVCSKCGRAYKEGAKYCSACGARLGGGAR